MRPNPDDLLRSIADKLERDVAPALEAYRQADMAMLGMLLRTIAERYEEDADILLREIEAMRQILELAAEAPEMETNIDLDGLRAAMLVQPTDRRMSSLRDAADALLVWVGKIFAVVDDQPAPLIRERVEVFLRERTILRSLGTTAFPSPELIALKPSLTLGVTG